MELRAFEVRQHVAPVGRIVDAAEVGPHLAGEELERRRLADAVRADEAEHLARPRDRQLVQLERVVAVAVRQRRRQRVRQIHDAHRVVWAALCAVQARRTRVLQHHAPHLAHLQARRLARLGTAEARLLAQIVEGRRVRLAAALVEEDDASEAGGERRRVVGRRTCAPSAAAPARGSRHLRRGPPAGAPAAVSRLPAVAVAAARRRCVAAIAMATALELTFSTTPRLHDASATSIALTAGTKYVIAASRSARATSSYSSRRRRSTSPASSSRSPTTARAGSCARGHERDEGQRHAVQEGRALLAGEGRQHLGAGHAAGRRRAEDEDRRPVVAGARRCRAGGGIRDVPSAPPNGRRCAAGRGGDRQSDLHRKPVRSAHAEAERDPADD